MKKKKKVVPKKRNAHPTLKEKARILALTEQFDWMFATKGFERKFIFREYEVEDDHLTENQGVAAEIHFDAKYQRFTISIYPPFWKMSLEEQRKGLLHEYCHTLTIGKKVLMHDMLEGKFVSSGMISSANEELTSKIENLLDSLLCGGSRYVKKAYRKYTL